jgi:phosphate transport system substrate-binding protein
MTLLRAGLLQGADTLTIAGAGATFPQPLYLALFEAVAKQKQVVVRYDGVGSGDGIRALIERRVDFAGTDAFMSPAEIGKAGANVVQVPTCMGAVVLTYNLPGNIPIRLSPAVIADIFLGRITKWNDTRIMALNPNLRISDLSISVIQRSDSSGTTAIFTEYLAKVSHAWKEKVGSGKSITWPVGQGAKGNPGVAGMVSKVIGSLGYVELIYALGNNMKIAEVQNRSGQFVKPSVESVSLAAEVKIPDDTNVSLTDTEAPSGYPISGFTWIAVYQEQQYNGRSTELARELVNLIWWMIHEGQSIARQLHYAPLQKEAVQKSERLLQSILFNGRPLLTP